MIIRRIIWAITVILYSLMYVFVNSAISLSALVLAVLLPLISLSFALISKGGISADINLQNECVKGDTASGEVVIKNTSKLFYSCVKITLESENTKTGEISESEIIIIAKPDNITKKEFDLKCEHCGLNTVKIKSLLVLDSFRIFSFKLKSSPADSVIVLPKTFETSIFVENTSSFADSSQSVKKNASYDTSEIVGIREYIIGDSVNNIHWKLSEKTDKLLVKEFGQTVINKVLIFADTALYKGAQAHTYDAVSEVFASVMLSLLKEEITFSAGFGHTVKNISRLSELDEILREFLASKNEEDVSPLLKINTSEYSKIIFIISDLKPGEEYSDEKITAIRCGKNYENELSVIQI